MSKPDRNSLAPLAIVVMGVAGSGKTVVGQELAAHLGARFIEGDRFHSPRNIALMSAGTPLTDEDRADWLDRIGLAIAQAVVNEESTVTSCSALKRAYRDRLRNHHAGILFLFLEVDQQTAEERVALRRDHFMPKSLVPNQFATLEVPETDEVVFNVDAGQPPNGVVAGALLSLFGIIL